MPPLHPFLMAIFLGLFTVMAGWTLFQKVRERKPFPSLLLLLTVVVFGISTVITLTQ
ncbi:MAG: hypothetical protein OWU32_06970 [Firmicutes bacterium]|nr:hypothetical protein [Bacillota bacterium]